MAKKLRHITGKPYTRSVYLDAATLPQLDQIAPDNVSEAIRFCIAYALERGALAAALAQHTPQQRAAWLERYHQPQPITQLYNGQPIPTAGHTIAQANAVALEVAPAAPAPAPAPAPQPVEPKPAQISPADMLAYAQRFCSDDDLDAARLELEQMEAAARMQRNN